jgi:hypothetical protein
MASSPSLEQNIAHVLALRRVATAVHDAGERRRLERVLRELRRSVGSAVPKRRAANLLGVTVQALERWIGRGLLPVARKPGSSRELIDAAALFTLAEEVSRLRDAGRSHGVLAAAFRELERSGRLPRKLRPNQSARELRDSFLGTTAHERLREVTELSYAMGVVAGYGSASRP